MAQIFHYTSIQTLALILSTKMIRFNSLDNVDDMDEAETKDLGNFGKFCFVSCWTRDHTESIPLWSMYTPDMMGVRIGLEEDLFDPEFDVNKDNRRTGGLFDVPVNRLAFPELIDIQYIDKNAIIPPRIVATDPAATIQIMGDRLGRQKSNLWSFQQECRFRLLLRPNSENSTAISSSLEDFSSAWQHVPNINTVRPKQFIDFKLDENAMKQMEILLGPKTTPAEEVIVKSLGEKFELLGNIQKSSIRIRNRR